MSSMTYTCPVCGHGTESAGTDASSRGSIESFRAEHGKAHAEEARGWSVNAEIESATTAAHNAMFAANEAAERRRSHDATVGRAAARALARASLLLSLQAEQLNAARNPVLHVSGFVEGSRARSVSVALVEGHLTDVANGVLGVIRAQGHTYTQSTTRTLDGYLVEVEALVDVNGTEMWHLFTTKRDPWPMTWPIPDAASAGERR